MSRGRPSRPQTAVGDHPSCTNKVRKDGETAGSAHSTCRGLGLDGGRAAGPHKRKRTVSPSGLANHAQGMEAAWPRQQARFTTAQPGRMRNTSEFERNHTGLMRCGWCSAIKAFVSCSPRLLNFSIHSSDMAEKSVGYAKASSRVTRSSGGHAKRASFCPR